MDSLEAQSKGFQPYKDCAPMSIVSREKYAMQSMMRDLRQLAALMVVIATSLVAANQIKRNWTDLQR